MLTILNISSDFSDFMPEDRLRFMEEQQEKLNSNLIALSTHFAQVSQKLNALMILQMDRICSRPGFLISFEGFHFIS